MLLYTVSNLYLYECVEIFWRNVSLCNDHSFAQTTQRLFACSMVGTAKNSRWYVSVEGNFHSQAKFASIIIHHISSIAFPSFSFSRQEPGISRPLCVERETFCRFLDCMSLFCGKLSICVFFIWTGFLYREKWGLIKKWFSFKWRLLNWMLLNVSLTCFFLFIVYYCVFKRINSTNEYGLVGN